MRINHCLAGSADTLPFYPTTMQASLVQEVELFITSMAFLVTAITNICEGRKNLQRPLGCWFHIARNEIEMADIDAGVCTFQPHPSN